ncbi:hypothetical protein ACFDR9_005395, partial [Janthinobacterium sp. CG_23.3]
NIESKRLFQRVYKRYLQAVLIASAPPSCNRPGAARLAAANVVGLRYANPTYYTLT